MGKCLRCGQHAEGQYCDSCGFYELNAQCWRCRMYLPKIELQQWHGQIYCPYCVQDIRNDQKESDERRAENARGPSREGGQGPAGPDVPSGGGTAVRADYQCDRCKDDLDVVYVVADHKFCEVCFHLHQQKYKESGAAPPAYIKFNIKSNPGLLASILRYLKNIIKAEWEKRRKGK